MKHAKTQATTTHTKSCKQQVSNVHSPVHKNNVCHISPQARPHLSQMVSKFARVRVEDQRISYVTKSTTPLEIICNGPSAFPFHVVTNVKVG